MPATDLAPIYDMLTACGFTRMTDTRQPQARWFGREVGDTMIHVAVYPRGTHVPAPETPAPSVYLHVTSLVPYWSNRWAADFRAGTPARVVIAAISAAMKAAADPAQDLGTHADLPDPVHRGDVFSRIEASTHGTD